MHFLRKASTRSAAAAFVFAASALSTSSAMAAPGDYCLHADGTVYCGVEENIVEGDPGLRACIDRWERAIRDCPPE